MWTLDNGKIVQINKNFHGIQLGTNLTTCKLRKKNYAIQYVIYYYKPKSQKLFTFIFVYVF